jgi:hypothetical protein
MNIEDEILRISRSVSRIEGRLESLPGLSERVSKLEHWHAWLKGGWAFLVAVFAYLFRGTYAK